MSSLLAGKHPGSGVASNQPAVVKLRFAERARTLMYLERVGRRSTVPRNQQGHQSGSCELLEVSRNHESSWRTIW